MLNARELTNHLASLLRDERGVMADFLLALADYDRNKVWRELGHTSLFYFLRRELKLSAGAAQNRKTAAELIQKFPAVEAALRAGDLCLSTVNEVAKVLTRENEGEVLPRFFGLSRREAEEVAVSLRPAEVVPMREVVTTIRPAAAVRAASPAARSPVAATKADPAAAFAFHLDEPAAPVPAPVPQPVTAPPRDSIEPLDAELSRLHITVSRGLLEKLEAARDALSHACPGASAGEILERGLDLVLAEHAKRKGLVAKPRKEPRPSRTDAIPAHVKREVWHRAGGRCEWRFESGERCGCTRKLEFDHIEPLALGGPSTIENVRLACRPHNLLACCPCRTWLSLQRVTNPAQPARSSETFLRSASGSPFAIQPPTVSRSAASRSASSSLDECSAMRTPFVFCRPRRTVTSPSPDRPGMFTSTRTRSGSSVITFSVAPNGPRWATTS